MIDFPKFSKTLAILALLATVQASAARAQYAPLPSYNIDKSKISVSGISSGADMAVQFEVAFSSQVMGAGIIAGSPYFCAQGNPDQATEVCTCFLGCSYKPIDLQKLADATRQNAQLGKIDDPVHLARHRVWLLSGTKDRLVPQDKMEATAEYYKTFIDKSQIFFKKDLAAGHSMPTDHYGNVCDTQADPYINKCSYDAAGEMLRWIYGPLQPRNTGPLGGSFVQFDQSEFIQNPGAHSMAGDGWLYVPASCKDGRGACKLHVALHGCDQYQAQSWWDLTFPYFHSFGRTFVDHAGYNAWADTNDMIVLYPQATRSKDNPFGCWDWWGYDGPDYALKTSRQMAAIKGMIDRISAPPPPPKGEARSDR